MSAFLGADVERTLYVAGGITGVPDFRERFGDAQARLEAAGFIVESPTADGEHEGYTWLDYMRRGALQLARCGGVATLAGWEASRGARIEVGWALAVGIPVRPVEAWLEVGPPAS